MGPPRPRDQVEISRTDEFKLGVDAPVRISGDSRIRPSLPSRARRAVTLTEGLICAWRHIHMSAGDAGRLGVRRATGSRSHRQRGRDLLFGDVIVRVGPNFKLEMHIDTDEANAAGVRPRAIYAELLSPRLE